MSVRAVVHLNNIVFNAKAIKKRLPSGVKFCAVVKADGYGHGAEKVANAVYNLVDCFSVATVEEGVKLRLSGIDKEILVLTAAKGDEVFRAIDYSLILTAGDASELKRYARAGKERGVKVKVHIKYDTGMRRQGVSDVYGLKAMLAICSLSGFIELCGLYSHFARPENDASRRSAVKKFVVAKNLVKGYNKDATCHISASGGFIKGEYFDMVRIGILLYGYKPFSTDAIKVKPALTVFAPVLQRRTLRRGEVALYGDKKVAKTTRVALVRYGYADGLFRKEVAGQFNNRCMDITAMTGVGKRVREVAVMDDAAKIAKKYGTIPYEILVKCALRAEKEYKS